MATSMSMAPAVGLDEVPFLAGAEGEGRAGAPQDLKGAGPPSPRARRWPLAVKLGGVSLFLGAAVLAAFWLPPSGARAPAPEAAEGRSAAISPEGVVGLSGVLRANVQLGLAGMPSIAGSGKVLRVTRGSAAERAGIRPGMTLNSINGVKYSGAASIRSAKEKVFRQYIRGGSSSVYLACRFKEGTKHVRLDWVGLHYHGNKVASVTRNSAAAAAGIRPGMVITSVAGHRVSNSNSAVTSAFIKGKKQAFSNYIHRRSSVLEIGLAK